MPKSKEVSSTVKLTSTDSPSYSSIAATTVHQTPELVVIGLFGSLGGLIFGYHTGEEETTQSNEKE
jgi:hypothetical protein